MKLLQKTLLALTTGALMTAGAQAAVNYNAYNTAQPYLGAKVGQYDLDDADDEATSYGVYGGFEVTPNWGIEAEYMTTSEEDFASNSVAKSEYEGEVYGLYGTYKYMFPNTNGIYAKGRLGIAKNEVEISTKGNVTGTKYSNLSNSESDTGIAGGLGFGYNFTPNAAVEIAYDWYPTVDDVKTLSNPNGEDLDASGFTLGANFRF